MYVKERYKPGSQSQIHELIQKYPLAAIVGSDAGGFTSSHLPLILDPAKGPKRTLVGHMARVNTQCTALQSNPRVLAIFTGPSGCVSPRWYKQRAIAPTWNYAAVHCHGRLRFATDDDLTVHAIQMLLEHMGRPGGWNTSELGDDGLRRRLPHIVGFEITIESIEAKFQMSQYQRDVDAVDAIAALRSEGRNELADAMLRWSGVWQESHD